MKTKLLLTVLLLAFSVSCFGKPKYTISKTDFIAQFTDPSPLNRFYCTDEAGTKVWLDCNDNSELTLKIKNNKEKVLTIHTVKYKNDTIEGAEASVWMPRKKLSTFNIQDVISFTIEGKFQEQVLPYFNRDSLYAVVIKLNDSLKAKYATGTELIINLHAKEKPKSDTIPIIANACYHIGFKDNINIWNGVVQKITKDSIYISSSFNPEMAAANKVEYKIHSYAIHDISDLKLLKSGGYGYKTIKIEDYDIAVKEVESTTLCCPYWYTLDNRFGQIRFYRSFLTDSCFPGITEIDGKPTWFER